MKTYFHSRVILGILVIALILSLMPAMAIASFAEETSSELPVLNETVVGTVNFQSFNFLGNNNTLTDGKDYNTTFYYTDDYFAPSAVKENVSQVENWTKLTDLEKSLATASFDFTVASYTTNVGNVLPEGNPSWKNTDYSNKDCNARDFLTECGFKNFESCDEYNAVPTMDSIGYVMANKKITVFDEETQKNKEFTLVAVGIRGAGYGAEWASNVTIGDPNNPTSVFRHKGFDDKAIEVCQGIKDYINDSEHPITGDVKYWVVGFSRAAAVANLAAAYLTDEAEDYHTAKKDIYGYTFECPKGANKSENALDYTNIHNIINALDAVPKVSPDQFGHQRLGVDYVMPYYGNTLSSTENSTYYNRMRSILQTIAVGYNGEEDPLIESTANYPYNGPVPIYTVSARQLIDDGLSGDLADNFGTYEAVTGITNAFSRGYVGSSSSDKLGSGQWYMDKFIDELIKVFLTSTSWDREYNNSTTNITTHRTRFIEKYQNDFRTLFGYLLDFSGPAFLGLLDQVLDAVGDQIGTVNWRNARNNTGFALAFAGFYFISQSGFKDSLISESQTLVKNIVNNMTADFPDPPSDENHNKISRAQMNAALDRVVALVIDLYAVELDQYKSQYFGTTLHYLNEILSTHEQEVVMSWNMAVDPNHINRGYRTITVPKTTNVKLYEFRDRYAELEGTLSPNGAGALVAEYENGAPVGMTSPDGRSVENLDQRISVTSNGDNMIIRYPSMLNIRADVSAMNENTYFDDVPYQVADYMTKTMTTAVSDGEDQYDPAKSVASNYTAITTNTNKTNAGTINGYNSYQIPLSSYDTLQIMAKGTRTFDNTGSGDKNVYSINKKTYVNTIVEGQFRQETGGVEAYLPYVMDQDGMISQPEEVQDKVEYTAIHGTGSDTKEETGTGSENPKAQKGNSFTVDLPVIKNDNKVIKYFVTDSRAENNQRRSSDTQAYVPSSGLVEETKEQFTYNPGSQIRNILEAEDRVYHVFYDGDFKYTVLWKNEDGTQLEKDENVKYNTDPEYNGATPTKASSDTDYKWEFTGWTPDIEKVTKDVTYTAVFEQHPVAPVTFTLVHQNGEPEIITMNNATKGYNVTNEVASGMMYGGLFTTSDYKTPSSTPGTKLIPEDGKTYYMREVSKTYLQARNVYLTKSGKVIGTYGVAVTDDKNYKEAGFLYNGNRIPSMKKDGVSKLYSDVTFVNVNGGKPFTPKDIYSQTETPSSEAKIVVSRLDDAATGTVQAYWITADNVLVKGDTIRNLKDGYKVGTTDPNKKYSTEVNPYTEAPTYQESGIPVSSIFVGYEDEEEEPIDNGIKLAGYTTSLNGNIAMNFYMDLSDSAAADKDAYMQFTLPGANHTEEMVKLTDAKKQVRGDKIYYVFSAGVAAKDMTSDIKAQFVKGDGTKSEVWTYTIKEYCDYIRSHPESYDKESVALVENMLNYGGYAQTYFKHNTDKMANADLDLVLPEVNLDESFDPVISGETEGLTYKGSSAMLTTTTGLRHYFELTGDASDYTFKANGAELELHSDKNNSYVLIDNIKAKDLKKPITLTVTDKNGNEFKLSYSVYTNIKQVVGNNQFNDASQDLMKALYGYGQAAIEYFATR